MDPAQTAPREERKVVTILFADLVGFTSKAERMDPEDVRELLGTYHDHVRRELERFGGTVEKFIGDAAMAVFGAPFAHEDDPERAVRAALAIRDWVREEEGDLQIRVGLNTGEVLVALGARPSEGEAMVAGDVVNSAARIQSAAPVNGILVADSTYRATRSAIDYRQAESVVAKGKARPIATWEALTARARVGVERQGGAALVGRGQELTLLRNALARATAEREPQLATLIGVPGIGKSRLVFELFKAVEAGGELVYWRRGRSLPYGEGVAFWALAEMVKAQAGILEADPAAAAEDKLRAAVSELVDDPADARWVEAHLLPLIGVVTEPERRATSGQDAFAAWRRFFESMAERHPLVLVFEDLHWADDALLEFVDELVDWARGVPLMVVVTARPELMTRRPDWGGGKPNATTISLPPLSDDETAQLVHALLGRSVLPAETQSSLVRRSGGNPLYMEEFVALVHELGQQDEVLPDSVQSIIAARLDALAPEEKGLLQDAAVLGRVFWAGALAHLAGPDLRDVERRLHRLERREFVRRERRSALAGETEYVFRHVLVRDVAYSQIPRRRRAECHRLAAEWIESLGRPEDHAELLAHHYLAAVELARASSMDVEPLLEKARTAARRAGDRAFSLNAFDGAARFYAATLELMPPEAPDRPQMLLLMGQAMSRSGQDAESTLEEATRALIEAGDLEGAARAQIFLADADWRGKGDRDRAYGRVDRAVELLEDREPSPAKAFVLSEVARYHFVGSRHHDAEEIGRQALRLAEQLGLDEIRAQTLCTIGAARAQSSGDQAGLDDLRRSIEIAGDTHPIAASRARNNLGACLLLLGDFRGASAAWTSGFELAERFRGVPWADWLLGERIAVEYGLGRWDDSERGSEEFLRRLGPRHYQVEYFSSIRGRIRLARGDLAGALEDTRAAMESARRTKDPQALQPALACAAFVLLSAGRLDECTDRIDELLAMDPAGVPVGELPSPILDLAWVLTALGRADEFLTTAAGAAFSTRWLEAGTAYALGQVEKAVDICTAIGSQPEEAYMRMRAAERLIADGQPDAAEAHLQKALVFYRSVRADAYIREAETLRAAYTTMDATAGTNDG